jgi:transcriptional activator SPT8
MLGQTGLANTPRLFRTLRTPTSSGVVSCVVAFPDCRHIAWLADFRRICHELKYVISASVDNIRLWNVADGEDPGRSKGPLQFKIIPGHHGGYISQMSTVFLVRRFPAAV